MLAPLVSQVHGEPESSQPLTRTNSLTAHVCTFTHRLHQVRKTALPPLWEDVQNDQAPSSPPETDAEEAALTGLPPGEDGPGQTHEQGPVTVSDKPRARDTGILKLLWPRVFEWELKLQSDSLLRTVFPLQGGRKEKKNPFPTARKILSVSQRRFQTPASLRSE